MTHSQITSFIWSTADLIRDTVRRGKYQDVILPLTVLRRIDQVLEPTKEKVLTTYSEFKGKLDNPDDLLRKAYVAIMIEVSQGGSRSSKPSRIESKE